MFVNKTYKLNFLIMERKEIFICNWCNQPSTIIWVHGHGQCAVCGYNVDECCRGESAECNNLNSSEENKENSDEKN